MSGAAMERCFTAADAALLVPGVVASADGRRIWYVRRDAVAAVRAALAVARRSWVQAVTVVPEAADAAQIGLALVFAEHLRAVRRRRGVPGVCVTSPLPPILPSARVRRLPHLVATVGPEGVQDVAVWEIMTANRLAAWFGRHTMDVGVLEAWLPRLLALRRTIRDGHLPEGPAGRALAELLRERYLSTRLVVEHSHLFADLLDDPSTVKEAPAS
ncbi:hypothetical protein AB0D67_32635 [Streptosporangium sp. NPDC048047]|uniref:hypothetical protein n=1 Tax=Streptosporangium sp. NPDC048047 TaxID=3155748 RepID=UPI0034470449